MAPDGNGGVFKALIKENILPHMESHGIEHVHVYCVDNVLVRVADPIFIGFCSSGNHDCGSKVVEKLLPEESVGLIVQKNGKYSVLEYSEMDPNFIQLKDSKDKSKLLYRHANIANHYFHINFFKKLTRETIASTLSYHIAKKKIPFINPEGMVVKPNSPNGVKLELFIFDVFPLSKSMGILEVKRSEEFSPLKNGPGSNSDSPESSRRELMNLCLSYLEKNGWDDSEYKETKETLICEISPKITYQGEGLPNLTSYRLAFPLIIKQEEDWSSYKK